MSTRDIIIIAAIVGLVVIIIASVIINKSHKDKVKKAVEELYVRFTTIKTIPIAFKLNKAKAMSQRSSEMSAQVEQYRLRYENAQKGLDELQESLADLDDALVTKKYKEIIEEIDEVSSKVKASEDEINDIDKFLEEFSRKENEQRDFSVKLKEKYRVVKTTINKNSQLLSISYDGFMNKLEECEKMFSLSEEYMYDSDYGSAQAELEKIDKALEDIKVSANAVPKLVKDTKGVLPIMLDEIKREVALTKQRGVYIEHLDPDKKIEDIENTLNDDVRKISGASTDGIKSNISEAKDVLNELNEQLAAENRSYKQAKDTNDQAYNHILDMEKVLEYVKDAYEKDSARFGLDDLSDILVQKQENIKSYRGRYETLAADLGSSIRPSSKILTDVDELNNAIEADMKTLYSYKTTIDKSTDGETRAKVQLTKLQLVVSEVESKLAEYSLPSIDESYKNDLKKSREYIEQIRVMSSKEVIDINDLNNLLDEAIDFIYKFYNNINNVVGMSVMVENAIVFGNKYRSTYPQIDRELSKAEFQYLSGEYTKALKTAITCMETLFPDDANEKILESV